MRVVGLVEAQEPRKTPGKPQGSTPKGPDAKAEPSKTSGK